MKFVAVCVATILLCACGARSSDEQQVRTLLEEMEAAAEARDTSDLLEHIAADYSDSQGFDRAQLQGFLRGYFLVNPKVEALVGVEELQFPVEGLGRARVTVRVLPSGDRATLQVEFRKEGGRWRVARADRARE